MAGARRHCAASCLVLCIAACVHGRRAFTPNLVAAMGRTFGPSLLTLKIASKVAWEQLREGETVEDGWASLVAALPNLRTTIMISSRRKVVAAVCMARACEAARRVMTMRVPSGQLPKLTARSYRFVTFEVRVGSSASRRQCKFQADRGYTVRGNWDDPVLSRWYNPGWLCCSLPHTWSRPMSPCRLHERSTRATQRCSSAAMWLRKPRAAEERGARLAFLHAALSPALSREREGPVWWRGGDTEGESIYPDGPHHHN